MTFKESCKRAWTPEGDSKSRLSLCGLGLAGEAGEVVDVIKKVVAHGHVLDKEKLRNEIGDVLYYIEMLCIETGITPEECKIANIEKLKLRYPNGFSTEASINRTK